MDADDLDDLLDEIEGSLADPTSFPVTKNEEPTLKTSMSADEEMDNLINEICSDDDPLPIRYTHRKPTKVLTAQPINRCSTLILGGSQSIMGQYGRRTPRSCDRLRCTSCDFQVVYFNDQEWNSKCDYLFFRNNMPNVRKLRQNLVKKRGSRAYACQCCWVSICADVEVSSVNNLKWVCGKH